MNGPRFHIWLSHLFFLVTLCALLAAMVAHLWEYAGAKQVTEIAFSPDGKRVAAAFRDSEIRLWNVPGYWTWPRRLRAICDGRFDSGSSVLRFSDAGTLIVAGWESRDRQRIPKLMQWDIERNRPVSVVDLERMPDRIALSSSSIAATQRAKQIHLWDVAQERPLHMFEAKDAPEWLVLAPNGQTFAAHWPSNRWPASAGVCRTQHPEATLLFLDRLRWLDVDGAAFSDDGQLFAAAKSSVLGVWDATTGQQMVSYRLPPADDRGPGIGLRQRIAFLPDGETLALSSNMSSRVELWSLTRQTPTGQLTPRGPAFLRRFAASPQGSLVAVEGDGDIELWDIERGRYVRRLRPGNRLLATLFFSAVVSGWTAAWGWFIRRTPAESLVSTRETRLVWRGCLLGGMAAIMTSLGVWYGLGWSWAWLGLPGVLCGAWCILVVVRDGEDGLRIGEWKRFAAAVQTWET